MDSGFTSYRSSSEEMKRISERMEAFNRGRTDKSGIYAISLHRLALIMPFGGYFPMIPFPYLSGHWPLCWKPRWNVRLLHS